MKLTIKEMTLFGMLGAVMYISKVMLEFLPNVHMLGMLTVAYTIVYRKKALYPIYVYVLLNGLFTGGGDRSDEEKQPDGGTPQKSSLFPGGILKNLLSDLEKTKNLIAEKNGRKVGMYDKKSGELIKVFVSMREAAKYLLENNKTKNKSADTRIATICNHVKGQGQTAYGYKWEFLK